MFTNVKNSGNGRRDETIYNSLSKDNMNHSGIDQSYSDQNQLSQPGILINNISGDETDTKNDDSYCMVSMDTTEAAESMAIPIERTAQLTLNPMSSTSSSSPTFRLHGQQNMSSITTYQAKCPSTTTSAQRCRQWQILSGGFGEGYDVLLPEEGDIEENRETESDEENDLEDDMRTFLEQIITVHVRKTLIKGGTTGPLSSSFKCNCMRSNCRVDQYLATNVMNKVPKIKEVKLTTESRKPLFSSRSLSVEYSSYSASDILSDYDSSNSGLVTGSIMLNTVLKNKNNLNLSTENHLGNNDSENTKQTIQHHNQNRIDRSSRVVKEYQKQYHNHRGKRNAYKKEYLSCYTMPDLPKESSIDLREAHADILRRAGGVKRVNKLYDELVFLSHCFGGWRTLLETSPKEGNSLLMWLCCQPLKEQTGERICRKTTDNSRSLYSQIVSVTMAMISDAYENPTKDAKDKQCLLFARNSQEASALELASLTNKSVIACWLALLYPWFGRDVNETNEQGQSVLHLLARIGDEAADTLQALLKLRTSSISSSSALYGRLFRLDVVNSGAKTPLDVAVACAELYGSKDGMTGILYQRVIRYFHEMIIDEAEEFEMKMALEKNRKDH